MKTRVNKTEDVLDIIYQYWNQSGETISDRAKEYLEEQIEMNSMEIDLPEE